MRMIFVNLPVKDVVRTREFFAALGFGFNAQFSTDDTLCMFIEENIYAMFLQHGRFKDFVTGEIADPARGPEVLTCLSCDSRQEVDALLEKAFAAGAGAWKPVMDMGPMYGGSFQDLDGHVWELVYMDPAAVQPPA
jgi:predicted lactoylglutathione lyase